VNRATGLRAQAPRPRGSPAGRPAIRANSVYVTGPPGLISRITRQACAMKSPAATLLDGHLVERGEVAVQIGAHVVGRRTHVVGRLRIAGQRRMDEREQLVDVGGEAGGAHATRLAHHDRERAGGGLHRLVNQHLVLQGLGHSLARRGGPCATFCGPVDNGGQEARQSLISA
jgi:hypothetical protein